MFNLSTALDLMNSILKMNWHKEVENSNIFIDGLFKNNFTQVNGFNEYFIVKS